MDGAGNHKKLLKMTISSESPILIENASFLMITGRFFNQKYPLFIESCLISVKKSPFFG